MTQPFIAGLDLCGLFYEQAVCPILARRFPDLIYSAALLGPGSDVLGFDTPQSRDHDWGPRLLLFLAQDDYAIYGEQIDLALGQELPATFYGYPTNFGFHEDGTAVMMAHEKGPVDHRVRILLVEGFCQDLLGFDPMDAMRAVDWLIVPENHLLLLTGGRVYHDGLGQLGPLRTRLRYYPDDVWLYLLAAQWRRIAQEEAFMGRCGQVGDDLGSRLIAARLVRDLMRLCFLMERRYAPYIKWLGTAFARLDCAGNLHPVLSRILEASGWPERQTHLSTATEFVADMHNALGLTEPLPAKVSQFHDRPFLVIHADRFVDALRGAIRSDEVQALPEHLGSVDQFVDSTDALSNLDRWRAVYAQV